MSYVLKANTPTPIILHFDSRFATTFLSTDSAGLPLSTNYLYTLIEPIIVPEGMNVLLSLHTATIPYSFYNVRDGVNNKVYYDIGGGLLSFDLDAGNYSATGLASFIKTKLELHGGLGDTIQYSRETLKFTFTITGVPSFHFRFSNTTETASELLGFRDIDTEIPIGVSTKSNRAIDLNDAIHGLYIRQNLATRGTLDNELGTFSNILARLPITTNAGGIIFYDPSMSDHSTMVNPHYIQSIGIKLTDDRNRPLDLNGLHWQVSFKIAFIHKEDLKTLPIRRPLPNQKLMEKPKTRKKKSK